MTQTENIPKELKRLDRWVCVSNATKRPFSAIDGSPASSTDSTTWASYKEALRVLKAGRCDYLGYVFVDGDGLVGIDIDHCSDELGFFTDEARLAVTACATYFEISRSGEGLHIIAEGDIPFDGANNRHGWEIYKNRRYFILTGNTRWGATIRPAQEAIDEILKTHFSDEVEHTRSQDKRNGNIWEPFWGEVIDGRIPTSPEYPVISPGSRHLSLVSFCGQMKAAGAAPSTVLAMANEVNAQYMNPPLSDDEVSQVVRSVSKSRR